ncbi:uncharacterized protein LODBEIA_P52820 [Lodderomyces beijingensis]|uniref:Protein MAK11 n=1 Tax=Lodderomyces beijingensis TaxID=1775926 RepID=A0ABP0ZTS4_9ASCO
MAKGVTKGNEIANEPKEEQQPTTKKVKSALKGGSATISTKSDAVASPIQFRIFVGSYEHNLLCLSVILDPKNSKEPVFQPIFHFQAHALSIKSIDLAKRYLVTGSNDEHIRIYDLQKRKELGTLLGHQGTITTLRFSKEGAQAAAEEAEGGATSSAAAGKWLLSGSEDGKIIIWRTKDWEVFATLKGHTDKINDLSVHPSGRVAISVSQDKTIRLWNLMTAKKAAVLKIKGRDHLGHSGQFVNWSADGHFFLVGLNNSILLYRTSTATIVKKLRFKSTIMCMQMDKFENRQWLVVGFADGSIGFYDFEEIIESILDASEEEEEEEKAAVENKESESLEPVFVLRVHTNRIKDFYFFQNQDTQNIPFLISVSSDGKVVISNLAIKDQVAVYDTGERLNCVVCSPEHVEKVDSMKKRFAEEEPNIDASESEFETDGEEIKAILSGQKRSSSNKRNKKNSNKNKSKNKKRKVKVTLE